MFNSLAFFSLSLSLSHTHAHALRTPLILSTGSEGLACLTTLIKQLNQSQINDCDNEQMTALHWSAYNNATESLKALLKAVSTRVQCASMHVQ